MSRLFILFLLLLTYPICSQVETLSRERIDGWLQHLGVSDKLDVSKGIDWGVMPGPSYTSELGLGIGTAVVGMYHPDPQDTTSQNSILMPSGYASSTGAFSLSAKNYAFFDNDPWRVFVEGSMANAPTYYWGQGFHAGDKDNEKEKYTAQVLTLRPITCRQLVNNVCLGAEWSLAAQDADEMDHDDLSKIESASQGPPVFSSSVSIDTNWDDRGFVPNSRRGQYANFRYIHYTLGLGSDTRFDELQLHCSHYHALSEKSVLAWEADSAFTQGDISWSMIPLPGGDERMRDYYQGRYRDKNVVSSQLEYRRQLTWWHGIVAWVGAETMGLLLSSLNNGRWLPTGGVDYRSEFKPRVNIRLDYGIGKGSSGFYFQVGKVLQAHCRAFNPARIVVC